jgi:hypothetical protein
MVYGLFCPIIYGGRVAYCKEVAVAFLIYLRFTFQKDVIMIQPINILLCSCLSFCHHFCYVTPLEFFNAGSLALPAKGVVII